MTPQAKYCTVELLLSNSYLAVLMAKPLFKKRARAIRLRLQGKSYSQIKKELQVSKSTLSLWLRNYPLPKQRLIQLQGRNERRIENFRKTMRLKREKRRRGVYLQEKAKWLPLTKRELYLLGLFLYWGEGLKADSAMVSFSNSNPEVLKFAIYWLRRVIGVPRKKIRARLHLYKDMDVKKETAFWSRQLRLPKTQFNKPYIKKTTLKSLTYKGFGHGTCDVAVGSVKLKEKIMMGIKALSGYYGARI